MTEEAIKKALAHDGEEKDIVFVMEGLRAAHGGESVDRALRRLGLNPRDFYQATIRTPALPRRDSTDRRFWLIPARRQQE